MKSSFKLVVGIFFVLFSFSAQAEFGLFKKKKVAHLLQHYDSNSSPYHLQKIIDENDTVLAKESMIHGYMNPDKDKIYCFFKRTFKNKDGSLKESTSNSFAFYIVAGVRYKGKWYFRKSASYVRIGSRSEWNWERIICNHIIDDYFKKWSFKVDPEFWEKGMFSKVTSWVEKYDKKIKKLRKKLSKSKGTTQRKSYTRQIDRYYEHDAENRNYIGLYTIVAAYKEKEVERKNERFEDSIAHFVLQPFFDRYVMDTDSVSGVKLHDNTSDAPYFVQIYPDDLSMIICPIGFLDSDGNSMLHYYVLLQNSKGKYQIYKWNYFKPKAPKYGKVGYGYDVYQDMQTVSKWNHSHKYLNDAQFWTTYVLKKNGDFVYLESAK